MGYVTRFYGIEMMSNGDRVKVELAEAGYEGPLVRKRLAGDLFKLDGGADDEFAYEALISTSGVATFFDPQKEVMEAVASRPKGSFQMRVYRLPKADFESAPKPPWPAKPNEFTGAVLPKPISKALHEFAETAQVEAVCALGYAKDVPFLLPEGGFVEGEMSVIELLRMGFAAMDQPLPIVVTSNWYPTELSYQACPLSALAVDTGVFRTDEGAEVRWESVFKQISARFGVTVQQSMGEWHVEHVHERYNGVVRAWRFHANGAIFYAGAYISGRNDSYDDKTVITAKAWEVALKEDSRLAMLMPLKGVRVATNFPVRNLVREGHDSRKGRGTTAEEGAFGRTGGLGASSLYGTPVGAPGYTSGTLSGRTASDNKGRPGPGQPTEFTNEDLAELDTLGGWAYTSKYWTNTGFYPNRLSTQFGLGDDGCPAIVVPAIGPYGSEWLWEMWQTLPMIRGGGGGQLLTEAHFYAALNSGQTSEHLYRAYYQITLTNRSNYNEVLYMDRDGSWDADTGDPATNPKILANGTGMAAGEWINDRLLSTEIPEGLWIPKVRFSGFGYHKDDLYKPDTSLNFKAPKLLQGRISKIVFKRVVSGTDISAEVNTALDAASAATEYRQDLDFAIGDAPVAGSAQALRVLLQGEYTPTLLWRRGDAAEEVKLNDLQARELLFGQRTAVPAYDLSLVLDQAADEGGTGWIYPHHALVRATTGERFRIGSFSISYGGAQGRYKAVRLQREEFEPDYESVGETSGAGSFGGVSGDGTGSLLVMAKGALNASTQNKVATLGAAIPIGDVTSMTLLPLGGSFLKAGDGLAMVSLETGSLIPFRLKSNTEEGQEVIEVGDYFDSDLPLTLEEVLPDRSPVILYAESLATILTLVRNGLVLRTKGRSVAIVGEAVSGPRTSLLVTGPSSDIREGTLLRIVPQDFDPVRVRVLRASEDILSGRGSLSFDSAEIDVQVGDYVEVHQSAFDALLSVHPDQILARVRRVAEATSVGKLAHNVILSVETDWTGPNLTIDGGTKLALRDGYGLQILNRKTGEVELVTVVGAFPSGSASITVNRSDLGLPWGSEVLIPASTSFGQLEVTDAKVEASVTRIAATRIFLGTVSGYPASGGTALGMMPVMSIRLVSGSKLLVESDGEDTVEVVISGTQEIVSGVGKTLTTNAMPAGITAFPPGNIYMTGQALGSSVKLIEDEASISVEGFRHRGDTFGTLNSTVAVGSVTSLPMTFDRAAQFHDADVIGIVDGDGVERKFTVNLGVSPTSYTAGQSVSLPVDPVDHGVEFAALSPLHIPSTSLRGEIKVTATEVALKLTTGELMQKIALTFWGVEEDVKMVRSGTWNGAAPTLSGGLWYLNPANRGTLGYAMTSGGDFMAVNAYLINAFISGTVESGTSMRSGATTAYAGTPLWELTGAGEFNQSHDTSASTYDRSYFDPATAEWVRVIGGALGRIKIIGGRIYGEDSAGQTFNFDGPAGTFVVDGNNAIWHEGNFTPANKLDASSYTAADVLAKLLTVDVNNSGLNANFLQGYVPGNFAADVHTHTYDSLTGKPTLSLVATSGDYPDLSNIPVEFPPSAHGHTSMLIFVSYTTGTVVVQDTTSGEQYELTGYLL